MLRMMQEGAASASAADYRRVRDVLSRCEALPTERDKAAFGAKNLEQDLSRLLRDATIEQHRNVLDRPLAKSALAGERHRPRLLDGIEKGPRSDHARMI